MKHIVTANLNRSGGWEVSSSPSLVIVDEGMAASISTTTINKGTYRYFDTDYSDGGFTYDIAQSGALIGLNFKF